MKLYSYVVRYDTGAAPNPFWGYCTLTICKPAIGRVAKVGDWIVGTGSKVNVGTDRLIYTMKVDEVLTLLDYGKDPRFQKKIPSTAGKRRKGDNIYYVNTYGVIVQRPHSMHSPKDMVHDLSGRNALISYPNNFYYFGREAPLIEEYSCLIKRGPGHKCNFPKESIASFLSWIQKQVPGINGLPYHFSEGSRQGNDQRKDSCSKCNS